MNPVRFRPISAVHTAFPSLAAWCALAAFTVFISASASAQVLITKDKRRINVSEVEVRDATVIQKQKLPQGGFAEIGFPLTSVVSVEWPLPPELSAAEAEVEQGSHLAALPALKAQAALHAPFRHANGSLWLRAQTSLVRAYAGAGLPDEAEREFTALKTDNPPAELLASLELDILLARAAAGEWAAYAPKFAALREAGLEEPDSARLWLAQAEQNRRRGQPEKALLEFLQVTVFHPRAESVQPAALLGAIRCYRALGETEQARLATEEILRRFAESPEAVTASKEIPSA